jgi:hypothetical protein
MPQATFATGVIVACLALGAITIGNSALAAQPRPAVLPVHVSNYTGLDELPGLLAAQIPPSAREVMQARRMAIFAMAEAFPSVHSCMAVIGESSVQSSANPSIADQTAVGKEGFDALDCKRRVLKKAISEFVRAQSTQWAAPIRRGFAGAQASAQTHPAAAAPQSHRMVTVAFSDGTRQALTALLPETIAGFVRARPLPEEIAVRSLSISGKNNFCASLWTSGANQQEPPPKPGAPSSASAAPMGQQLRSQFEETCNRFSSVRILDQLIQQPAQLRSWMRTPGGLPDRAAANGPPA